MNRWNHWNRRSCRTQRGMRYLSSCRRMRMSVALEDTRGSATSGFFTWRNLRKLPGVETEPRTIVEAAKKVSSLAYIGKKIRFGFVEEKKLSPGKRISKVKWIWDWLPGRLTRRSEEKSDCWKHSVIHFYNEGGRVTKWNPSEGFSSGPWY